MKLLLALLLTMPALAKPCAVPLTLDTWHSQCWQSCGDEARSIEALYTAVTQDPLIGALAWNETHDKCTKSCNRTLYKQLGPTCTKAIFP